MDTSKMSPDELLELLVALDKIGKLHVPTPEAVEPEALVRKMDTHWEKTRLTRVRAGKRKKEHWKKRKRKNRERMRPFMAKKYRDERLPLRTKLAKDGDWWSYYLMEWKKRCYKIEIKMEEWDEHIAPHLKADCVPVLYRMNTDKPIALYNILIKDQETKATLFDGQEWVLRKLGAIE